MEAILFWLASPSFWALAAITLAAGFIKGAVGFAMPMIMASVFPSFLSPPEALAATILPVLITNISQALRQGWRAAWESVIAYRRFLIGTLALIPVSAQFVDAIPHTVYLLMLGLPITAFALLQLAGVKLALRLEHRNLAEWLLGMIGGLYGGISGIWGPPLLVFLLSIGAGKQETVRVQGVVFLLGAMVLAFSHLETGVLNGHTLPLSALLVLPACIGLVTGYAVQDRLDPGVFRRWTQGLLVLTGLNLLRLAIL